MAVVESVFMYSRRIVCWACSDNLDTTLCTRALQRPLRQRQPPEWLLHHSDRGVQYTSLEYRTALAKSGLTRSVSRQGNCYDNATIESFWSTTKNECTDRQTFPTRAASELYVFDYIETFYNPVRLHSSLSDHPPSDFKLLFPPNQPPSPDAPTASKR